jgi:MFS family permease
VSVFKLVLLTVRIESSGCLAPKKPHLTHALLLVGMFIAARFILGFGLAITSNAAPTLVIEIAHPTHRGKITALYNTMWYLGSSKQNF